MWSVRRAELRSNNTPVPEEEYRSRKVPFRHVRRAIRIRRNSFVDKDERNNEDMDEDAKNAYFETIREARKYLNDLPQRKISESTLEEYKEIKNRIIGKDKRISNVTLKDWRNKPMAKSTFYKQRAALNYALTFQLQELLKKQDKLQRSKEYDLWEKCVRAINVTMHLMKENYFAPQLSVEEGLNRDRARDFTRPKKSKRASLGTFPDNWRELIFEKMQRSKFKPALAVAWLTGCRPSEIMNGVEVALTEKDGSKYLIFKVLGTKRGKNNNYGQEKRFVKVSITNPAASFLVNNIENNDNKNIIVSIETTEGFSQAVNDASKRIWKSKKEHVSPYSFRHSFSADVKSFANEVMMEEDESKRLIAQALGHSSADTQQNYGTSQQSKGSTSKVIISQIKAGEVKKSRKSSKGIKKDLDSVEPKFK